MKKLFTILVIGILLLTGCNKNQEKETFKVIYEKYDIVPGNIFDNSKISKEAKIVEVPNCAFGGKGIIYTYDDIEISTDENNLIYSVYYLSPNISTLEGLSLGDNKDKVISLYGNADINNNEIVYKKENVELSIILNNDIVSSIEYNFMNYEYGSK